MPEQTSNSRKRTYSAPALEKGLDILEALSEAPGGLSISGLADRLGRSVGQVFRMIAVLEQRGYIKTSEGTDNYIVTLKLFQLAHRITPIARLTNAADQVIKKLTREIEQSCHIVIYYEGRGHVVVQQDPPSERVLSVRLGAVAPLATTCSGHVLLAFASETDRRQMIAKVPASQPKLKPGALEKIVTEVRAAGHASLSSAQIEGVRDIGFPIFDHNQGVVAALVVPFLAYKDGSHPIALEDATEKASLAAQQISRAMGSLVE